MNREKLKTIAQKTIDDIESEKNYGFIARLMEESLRKETEFDGEYVQIEVDAVIQEKRPLRVRVRAFADDGGFLNAVSPQGASTVIEFPDA